MNNKKRKWTFITNHAVVLTILARNEKMTAREIAIEVKITERTVIKIINDLIDSGYVLKEKVGRTNHYKIVQKKPLRRNRFSEVYIEDFLNLISQEKGNDRFRKNRP